VRATVLLVLICLGAASTWAATSTRVVPTPVQANGFAFSPDGRIVMGSGGLNGSSGWFVSVVRLESIGFVSSLPEFSAFLAMPPVPVQAQTNAENTFAFCEDSPQPVHCNVDNTANPAGVHDCHFLWVFDSPERNAPNVMRRRRLGVRVNDPRTTAANVGTYLWLDPITPVQPTLRGVEPTTTKDGRLMIWQGNPANDGTIDSLVYSFNASPCALTGWSPPRSITVMASDPLVAGRYRLAEQPLRGADGSLYAVGAPFPGARPFLFPGGEALGFTAITTQCQPGGGPVGCGSRSAGLSIIGAPTKWQLALVDGELNPDADSTLRPFTVTASPQRPHFPSSPGDAAPVFGNMGSYAEILFDDAPPGAVGVWHFNELITTAGTIDRTRTPDSSGLALTGSVQGGASFPQVNNGRIGKALRFDGLSGRVEVAHVAALEPTNAITIELSVKPAVTPDCDGNDNARVLVAKPGSYALQLEDNLTVSGTVLVAGGATYRLNSRARVALGLWSTVAFQYDAATGSLSLVFNGAEVARANSPPASLAGAGAPLSFGSRGPRAACPSGDGAYDGELDEAAVFSAWRFGTPGSDGGMGGGAAGGGTAGGTSGGAAAGGASGGGAAGGTSGGAAAGGTSGGAAAGGTSGGGSAGGDTPQSGGSAGSSGGGGGMSAGGEPTDRKNGLTGWRLACTSADLGPWVMLALLHMRRRSVKASDLRRTSLPTSGRASSQTDLL